LIVDFLVGFLIFTSFLAFTIYFTVDSFSYPQPTGFIRVEASSYPVHLIIRRENEYLTVDCVEGLTVKVYAVCFNVDGSYIIIEGYTPLKLAYHSFLAVFSGASMKIYGFLRGFTGYISPHGVNCKPVETPYIHVVEGVPIEFNPEETGRFTVQVKRFITVNGTIMIGGG